MSTPYQAQHDRECRNLAGQYDVERCARCRWLSLTPYEQHDSYLGRPTAPKSRSEHEDTQDSNVQPLCSGPSITSEETS